LALRRFDALAWLAFSVQPKTLAETFRALSCYGPASPEGERELGDACVCELTAIAYVAIIDTAEIAVGEAPPAGGTSRCEER
jgi:hypothetical protein